MIIKNPEKKKNSLSIECEKKELHHKFVSGKNSNMETPTLLLSQPPSVMKLSNVNTDRK
jgi:hypothetical protein